VPGSKVESGVARFEGVLGGWYGWARVKGSTGTDPKHYREGGIHLLKLQAWLDARKLARKLARQ
jgi:hypothetical protein